MPSIDWTPYVDLTLHDLDASAIFDEAIDYAKTVLPEWNPQVGQIEVALLEAVATEVANAVYAINRLPGAVLETLLKLYGITRSDGIKATTTLSVTAIDNQGYTLPKDTAFAYFSPTGDAALVYLINTDLVIPNGSTSASVYATAQNIGVSYNSPAAGDNLQILSTAPYIASATFSEDPAGGQDAEVDSVFFRRATTLLQSFTSALSTARQIETFVLTNFPASVYRAKAYDRKRAADRDITAADHSDHDGYVLLAIASENNNFADTSDIELVNSKIVAISDTIVERVNPTLIVDVVNPIRVDVAVTCSVVIKSGYLASSVQNAIDTALNLYLSPNNWDWSGTVRETEIISLIDAVPGVDYVVGITSITTASTEATAVGNDLVFNQLGTLPYPGTHNITLA